MALIKCPECGREISDKSKACIHCGYPLDYVIEEKDASEKLICVHVHRVSKIGGSALTSAISVNGVQMGSVRNGGSCSFLIKPGLCMISIKTGGNAVWEGCHEETRQFNVEPGKDLYIEFSSSWGIKILTMTQK